MKETELKPFMEDEIYPLTITADRYTGTYSGGQFIAWNLDADEVPEEIYFDDCGCYEFWRDNEIVCGKGRTVSEALADLYVKLKGEDHEQRAEGYRKQIEGRWTPRHKDTKAFCTKCGALRDIETQEFWSFCPNCGAKMKGGAEK